MKRLILAAVVSGMGLSAAAYADSFKNFSEAAGDSADAGSRVVAAGGQVALGAVAVPLAAAGALAEGAGGAAGDIAEDLWDTANAPLTVDDAVVVAQPAPSLESPTNSDGGQ